MSGDYQSWGRLFRPQQTIIPLHSCFDIPAFDRAQSYLAYGNGRSYGDSCLNDEGILLATRSLDRFIDFDRHTGLLSCEAGVTLEEIIRLVLPKGWFLPVTPGTKFVTVGGAIANDVHGKNHHRAGTFGSHVEAFALLRSTGEISLCTPTENSALYRATIGGLGLTGLILWARIQLKAVPGPWLKGDSIRFESLKEFFALADESDRDWEYTVAWVDCAAKGRKLGRGIFMRANHGRHDQAEPKTSGASVPFSPPISLVNELSLSLFNQAYYARPAAQVHDTLWHYEPFFYPLDRILHWNRIYGPKGFYQFQCNIPHEHADAALEAQLRTIAEHGHGSFLAVLKVFGHRPSPGLLSFPKPGATLALDLPNKGSSTRAVLDRLEAITREAGGREYPAKDARMSAAAFEQYFESVPDFLPHMDPAFSSSFWRRVHNQKVGSQ